MGEWEKQVVVLHWGSLCRVGEGGGLQCVPGPGCLDVPITEGTGKSEVFMSCLGRLQ